MHPLPELMLGPFAMTISAQPSVIFAAIFAVVCFGVAVTGFLSLDAIDDPVRRADSVGSACFWTFLAAIATTFGGNGGWMVRTHEGHR